MADQQPAAPQGEESKGRGFGRGRGGDRGGRGGDRGRGGRGGASGRSGGGDIKEWVPCTKLGRMVKEAKVTTLEEIFLFSMPIKEHQIIDKLIPEGVLIDDVMTIFPVQKQSSAGQCTRFKAYVLVGDKNGHVGIGSRTGKEVALAIRSALISAKLNVIPIRRGYWGNKLGLPHTIPMKVTGKCGSVSMRLVPAPKGTGIVGAPVPTKIIEAAGIEDVYTSSKGSTRTRANFIMATFFALKKTYAFLTPDLWAATKPSRELIDEHSEFLAQFKATV